MLDVLTHMVTIESVAIGNCEDMHAQLVLDVGHQHIRVLVHLVRVTWNVPNTCCKSKLGDTVEPVECLFWNKLFGFHNTH